MIASLGDGATGRVLRAYDKELAQEVAIKIPHERGPRAVRRVREQFTALRSLSHAGLMALGEFFEASDPPFFTMELIEGQTLLEYVRSDGVCDEARLRDALTQLLRALRVLHRAGRVHGDIKPGHVRVTSAGRVVLLDLGVAPHATLERSWLGSAQYMAPEQTSGEASAASDLYALGTVLFECLTGELPFRGGSERILLRKHSSEAPKPSAVLPALEDLSQLCSALLSTDPGRRPAVGQVISLLGPRMSEQPSTMTASFMLGALPMVGRELEVARAFAACQESAKQGAELLISGESGAGKSTFLKHCVERLRQADDAAWVFADRCEPRPWQPYQGVSYALNQLIEKLKERQSEWALDLVPSDAHLFFDIFPAFRRLSAFARLEEGPRVPDPVERRWRAFAALRSFLANLTERVSVAIAIDDLHWADGDTLTLLRMLMEGERGDSRRPGVRWLLASNAPLPRELTASAEVKLAGLPYETAFALASELTSAARARELLSPFDAQRLRIQPREIVELVRHSLFFAEEGDELPLLAKQLDVRFARLERAPRHALVTCVVAGRPLSLAQLALATEMDAVQLTQSLGVLRSAGLIADLTVDDERAVEPACLEVRAAVIAASESAVLQDTHLRLVAAGQGAEQRPTASLLRFQLGSRQLAAARRTAHAAARNAEDVLAFEHAAHIYELASAAWEGEPDEVQRDVLRALGTMLACAGVNARSAASFDRASEGAKVADALELRRRAAEQWLRGGHLEQGMAELSELLTAVGAQLPRSGNQALRSMLFQRVRLSLRGLSFTRKTSRQISARELTAIDVYWSVGTSIGLVNFVSGADFQTRALSAALKAGEPTRIAKALSLEAIFTCVSEKPPCRRALHMIEIANAIAEELDDAHLRGLACLARSAVHLSLGAFSKGAEEANRAERLFRERCTGVIWEVGQAQQLTLLHLLQVGDFPSVAQRSERYMREALDRGDLYGHTSIVTLCGYLTPLLEDDPDTAEQMIDEAMAHWPKSSFHMQHFFELVAKTQIDLYRGGPLAHRRMKAAWPGLSTSMLMRAPMVRTSAQWLWALAQLAAHDGTRSSATDVARGMRRAAKYLAKKPASYSGPLIELMHAQACWIEGDRAGARLHAERARTGIQQFDLGLVRQCTNYFCGHLAGDADGRAEQERALAELSQLGVRNPLRYVQQSLPWVRQP